MEKEEQERVKAVVEEILAKADIREVTERKVRDLAAEETGIDLSQSRQWKRFVSDVITKYFESINYEAVTNRSASDADTGESKLTLEEEKPTRRDALRDSGCEKMKKTEEMEDMKTKEDVSDEEYEDDGEEARGGDKKRAKYETDEEGNHIICELSAKRKVVVSQWKGKTLISMREYYEKDGKVLPTSKGISLTVEQFEVLAKASNDIDRAISAVE